MDVDFGSKLAQINSKSLHIKFKAFTEREHCCIDAVNVLDYHCGIQTSCSVMNVH